MVENKIITVTAIAVMLGVTLFGVRALAGIKHLNNIPMLAKRKQLIYAALFIIGVATVFTFILIRENQLQLW